MAELRGKGIFGKQQNVCWPQAGVGKGKVCLPNEEKDRKMLRGLVTETDSQFGALRSS